MSTERRELPELSPILTQYGDDMTSQAMDKTKPGHGTSKTFSVLKSLVTTLLVVWKITVQHLLRI